MSFANRTSSEISAAVYSISVTASDRKFPWAATRSILSWRALTIVGWRSSWMATNITALTDGLTILDGSGLLTARMDVLALLGIDLDS